MMNLAKRNGKVNISESNPAQAQLIDNRYQLGQLLGKGGNARVYYAVDLKSNRPVALKLFFSELERDPYFVARFRKEVRIARSLQHPNIVRTIDYGYAADRYYLVMDYIDGCSLKDLIGRQVGNALDLEQTITLLGQVCEALQYAHSRGIIHRDIKPQNVLVDSQNRVYLGDFGLARAIANTGLTVTGPTIGTIGYLAPEQIQNRPLTAQTDIYALGVMLFEMVTGRLPFENTSALAVALAHVQQEAPLPRIYNPQVSPGLEVVIRRCMAKDPARRFGSVLELKANLIGCLSDETGYRLPVLETVIIPVREKVAITPSLKERADRVAGRPAFEDLVSLPSSVLQALDTALKAPPPVYSVDISHAKTAEAENPPIQADQTEPVTQVIVRSGKAKKVAQAAIWLLLALLLAEIALVGIFGFGWLGSASTTTAKAAVTPIAAVSSPAATADPAVSPAPAVSVAAPVQSVAAPNVSVMPGIRVAGNLSGVNLWRMQDSPVFVAEELIIGPGASLTIEPGVRVELASNVNLRVEGGKLQADGTTERAIIFTSAQAAPKAGDWGAVIISKDGVARLSNVEILYGGSEKALLFDPKHPALLINQAQLEMSASKVAFSAGAGLIVIGKSSGYVIASTFVRNADYQVYLDNKSVKFSGNQIESGGKSKL